MTLGSLPSPPKEGNDCENAKKMLSDLLVLPGIFSQCAKVNHDPQ